MKTLYLNGNIITMENEIYIDAVLTENGKIIEIGKEALLYKDSNDVKLFDLKGKTLLPGFIDAHSHFTAVANSFLQVSLDDCISFEEIGRRIQKFISDNNIKQGEWVLAKGYDNNQLKEKSHPKKNILDIYCKNNPLIIQHKSGHMGVLNSRGIEKLGLNLNTPSIDGGFIEVINNELTGYMEENSYLYYLKQIPMTDIKLLLEACNKAQYIYSSFGITTVQEGMMNDLQLPLYKKLLKNNQLYLDIVGYIGIDEIDKFLNTFKNSRREYYNHFKIGGIKIFLDGSPQGKTAWLRKPYKNEKEYCGYPTMEDSEVYDCIKYAYDNNLQILAHCNGDMAVNQYLEQIMKLENEQNNIKNIRPVMIHAQLLGIDQIDILKECSVIPSFFVAHTYYWGDTHIKNLGYDRAKNISPVKSAIEKGVDKFTFHQDSPVIEPNMMETIWCAVNRKTKSGEILGQEQCISVFEALKAVTINSAYQYFEEDIKGSIKVGKNADFVILSDNPLECDKDKIGNIDVLYTIKSDKIIYKKS